MAFIFDKDLIPSLPSRGASVGHHELMGGGSLPQPGVAAGHRVRVESNKEPKMPDAYPGGKVTTTSLLAHHAQGGTLDNALRKDPVFINAEGTKSNSDRKIDSRTDQRIKPVDNEDKLSRKPRRLPAIPVNIPRPTQKLLAQPDTPHATSSASNIQVGETMSSYVRSNSWSQPASSIHNIDRFESSCGPLTPPAACIRLANRNQNNSNADSPESILADLIQLIPPTRLDPLAPPPSSAHLHTRTLLSAFAFVLEALVAERTALTRPSPSDDQESLPHKPAQPLPPLVLPILRDRSSLQLPAKQGGTGELDWSKLSQYVESLGSTLDRLLPLLLGTELSSEGLDLLDMLKVYVNKIRRVFGEVAGLYVDEYSFMSAWWDEAGMRGSAREVGRWGELLDDN